VDGNPDNDMHNNSSWCRVDRGSDPVPVLENIQDIVKYSKNYEIT